MIVVTVEMSPRPDVIGSNDGRRPSQPDERTRNVLNATQALEVVASRLMEALVNVRGVPTPSRGKCSSFKEFYKHHFPMFKGNLNSGEAKEWFTSLEELLHVMDYMLWTTLRSKESSTQPTSSLERQGDGGTLRGTH
jgi:hypothetical protein